MKTLGEKVKFFRRRAEIKQLELEVALDMASGALSRIEQDAVNPTKETLIRIAESLKLNQMETSYLVGNLLAEPSKQDIDFAIQHFRKLLDRPDVFGYVLDQYSRIQELSLGFIGLAEANGVNWQGLIGHHVAEIILDPNLGLRKVLDESRMEDMISRVLAVMKVERGFMLDEGWYAELMERLRRLPDFQGHWDSISATEFDIYDIENRRVYFKFGEQIVEATFHITVLFSDPRFSFLEYILK